MAVDPRRNPDRPSVVRTPEERPRLAPFPNFRIAPVTELFLIGLASVVFWWRVGVVGGAVRAVGEGSGLRGARQRMIRTEISAVAVSFVDALVAVIVIVSSLFGVKSRIE